VLDDELRPLTYAQYMADAALRQRINERDNYYTLFLGATVVSLSPEWIAKHEQEYAGFQAHEHAQKFNPLMYYMPNSVEQLEFINDDECDVTAIVCGNRMGKTTSLFVKACFAMPLISCDPAWPCFVAHGIKYRPWRGPKKLALFAYNALNLADSVWTDTVRKWLPDHELGLLGRNYTGPGHKSAPTWGHDKQTQLKCGSALGWFTYEMDQGNFEGTAYDGVAWNEQPKEAIFHGMDRATRTLKGKHYFALTPHRVAGCPYPTGAGTWLHKFLTGKRTMGHKVRVYGGQLQDVPDWNYPESEKVKEIEKWETEPRRLGNRKMQAEGRARIYGDWQTTSGLVMDQWDEKIHVVDLPWEMPPDDCTLYRGIDHGGSVDPTVCLCIAVDPCGNVVVYREIYNVATVPENVPLIIRACGNTSKPIEPYRNDKTGLTFPRFEEVFTREGFWKTAMDSRSFSYREGNTGIPYGELYRMNGIRNIVQASGKETEHWLPIVHALMLPDKNRINPFTGEQGSPRLFVSSRCINLRREIGGWGYRTVYRKDGTSREVPADSDDHGPKTLGYIVQIPPVYIGNMFKSGPKSQGYSGGNYWADPLQKHKHKAKGDMLGYRPM